MNDNSALFRAGMYCNFCHKFKNFVRQPGQAADSSRSTLVKPSDQAPFDGASDVTALFSRLVEGTKS